jgi:hypothetical protein
MQSYLRVWGIIFIGMLSLPGICLSQKTHTIISLPKVTSIINVLASDSLEGRGNFSGGQLLAADFIASHFQKIGLKPWNSCPGYYQPFHTSGKLVKSISVELNGRILEDNEFIWLSHCLQQEKDSLLKFTVDRISTLTELQDFMQQHQMDTVNRVILFELPSQNAWKKITDYITNPINARTLIIQTKQPPDDLRLNIRPALPKESTLFNIIGVLPGKSKADEIVIFSSHYDHEGIKGNDIDNIYNGANDNASGTTAVMLLAEYFAITKQNERTLVFCCFAGEELGVKGSGDFSKWIKPEKITAMINIEMIGRPTGSIKNKPFITGAEKSNLMEIMNKAVTDGKTTFEKDRNYSSDLFFRSDNLPFARLGIPAHTIMCTGDKDPYYHTPKDEVRTLNLTYMTKIINLIATASTPLIDGSKRPSRIGKFFSPY